MRVNNTGRVSSPVTKGQVMTFRFPQIALKSVGSINVQRELATAGSLNRMLGDRTLQSFVEFKDGDLRGLSPAAHGLLTVAELYFSQDGYCDKRQGSWSSLIGVCQRFAEQNFPKIRSVAGFLRAFKPDLQNAFGADLEENFVPFRPGIGASLPDVVINVGASHFEPPNTATPGDRPHVWPLG